MTVASLQRDVAKPELLQRTNNCTVGMQVARLGDVAIGAKLAADGDIAFGFQDERMRTTGIRRSRSCILRTARTWRPSFLGRVAG